MSHHDVESDQGISRREALKTGAKIAGALVWATPAVQAIGMSAAHAQETSPPIEDGQGDITGVVVDASTASPIAGATVTVITTGQSDTTDSNGNYLITGVPAGTHDVSASASGYITQTQSVTVTAGATTVANFALAPVGAEIRVVLQWGASPSDLDSHMSGPDSPRFHVYYASPSYQDYVSLDVDDVDAFGPETITVTDSVSGGAWVAGTYHYWVHNFSRSTFAGSEARVTFFYGGAQHSQYLVSDAAGNPDDDIWLVFKFTIDASGNLLGTTTDQLFTTGDQGSIYAETGPGKG